MKSYIGSWFLENRPLTACHHERSNFLPVVSMVQSEHDRDIGRRAVYLALATNHETRKFVQLGVLHLHDDAASVLRCVRCNSQ